MPSPNGPAPGVRMTLIRPSPYDEVAQPPAVTGYNDVLIKYGDFVAALAKEHGFDVADLNANVVAMVKKAQATNPQVAARIIPDRVHPGPAGHLIMAGELIRAWKAPALVSSVKIDAAGNMWTSGDSGIGVFNSAGHRIGRIRIAGSAPNCEFGADGYLYIAGGTGLYRVKCKARKIGR